MLTESEHLNQIGARGAVKHSARRQGLFVDLRAGGRGLGAVSRLWQAAG